MTTSDCRRFELGDLQLQCGDILYDAQLAYETHGELNRARDNVVLLPTFYTGDHIRNRGFFGAGRAIDPARHFIISVNLFGNGVSTSPSNATPKSAAAKFPRVTLHDNIAAQHRLLTEQFGVTKIALVTGWSMAGCQTFHFASAYPEMVEAALPFCASARTSPHNRVFLEGVKAALQADNNYNDGDYDTPPIAGLRAFARVYAGWAYSQTFYRDALYRTLGFDSCEALLRDWERDHEAMDANNLLAQLWSWQHADISRDDKNFAAALRAIKAKTIIIACDQDLYFPPEDNAIEVQHITRRRVTGL